MGHRTISAAGRAHISAALKGKAHPHKGHKLSAIQIAAMAKGRIGKHHIVSAATKAKESAAHLGKHHKKH